MKQEIRIAPYALICSLLLTGCQAMERPSVIAATGTVIGFDVSQNSGTGNPQATLGYKRAEVAIVSDQKLADGPGKEDVANVVMELRYANEISDSSIYQRLAVGKTAVEGPGAAILFAKKPDGTVDPGVAASVSNAINSTVEDSDFEE